MPNPLIAAAVQFYNQIDSVDDSIQAKMWKRCILAWSLEARFGLNIDAVKNDVEGFNPESDIPTGKQSEVYKIVREFLKGVKEPPEWYAQWKDKKAEAMKAKLEAKTVPGDAEKTKDKDDDDDDEAEEKPEEKTDADADADAANKGQASAAVAGQTKIKVGDVVMGVAFKNKEKWAQKCKVNEILAKHYKVVMLEGAAKGENHKYLHKCVKAIPALAAPAAPAASASLAAASAEATAPNAAPAPAQGADSELMNVDSLFNA